MLRVRLVPRIGSSFSSAIFHFVQNSLQRQVWRQQGKSTYCHRKSFNIIKQAVQCFHIFLRPFNNYIIFFLQLFLSFQSSSINLFPPISPLIPYVQVSLGLPRFLLPGGRHFTTSFGNFLSSILWICPHH
jgi:hypothetical protein